MRFQRLILALVASLTTFLALSASSGYAASAVQHHSAKVTTSDPNANQCDIPGMQVDTFMANVVDLPDGTRRFEFWDRWMFTSALTGKSIERFSAEQMTTNIAPIDNGDGTVSFLFTFTGLEQRLKLPNGPVLARDVGPITFTLTYNGDGDLVFFGASDEKGPHPLLDGGGYCNVLVPALS